MNHPSTLPEGTLDLTRSLGVLAAIEARIEAEAAVAGDLEASE